MDAELVLDAKATLGEGAIWHTRGECLYWIDIEPGRLHIFNPADGSDRVFDVGQMIGTVVPRACGGWYGPWLSETYNVNLNPASVRTIGGKVL